MRYFFIAGEASGDLHASHLIRSLRANDAEAEFRGFGGDLMQAEGMQLLRHYRDLAYMGFVQVVLHLRTILRALRDCENAIECGVGGLSRFQFENRGMGEIAYPLSRFLLHRT